MSNATLTFALERAAEVGESPDKGIGIIVKTKMDWIRAREMRAAPGGHLLPVIDLTGGMHADADCHEAEAQQAVIETFAGRRNGLASWIRQAKDPEIRLLAHIFVRDRPLTARYAPNTRDAVDYGSLLPIETPRAVAERLAAGGYLSRKFFDRLHTCDRCGSARLSVREECASCHSAELESVSTLHHYRCVYSGPEEDFRADRDKLVCPKCARELRHYGSDHERSGTVLKCRSCGEFRGEPVVGFVCMDCNAHYSGDVVRTCDYYSYEINELGVALVHQADARKIRTLADLNQITPLEIIREVNRLSLSDKKGFSLCELSYAKERAIIREMGVEPFERARQALHAGLRTRLPATCLVSSGRVNDYVLLPAIGKSDGQRLIEQAMQEAVNEISLDLGAVANVFDHDELLPCSS